MGWILSHRRGLTQSHGGAKNYLVSGVLSINGECMLMVAPPQTGLRRGDFQGLDGLLAVQVPDWLKVYQQIQGGYGSPMARRWLMKS